MTGSSGPPPTLLCAFRRRSPPADLPYCQLSIQTYGTLLLDCENECEQDTVSLEECAPLARSASFSGRSVAAAAARYTALPICTSENLEDALGQKEAMSRWLLSYKRPSAASNTRARLCPVLAASFSSLTISSSSFTIAATLLSFALHDLLSAYVVQASLGVVWSLLLSWSRFAPSGLVCTPRSLARGSA